MNSYLLNLDKSPMLIEEAMDGILYIFEIVSSAVVMKIFYSEVLTLIIPYSPDFLLNKLSYKLLDRYHQKELI